MVDALIGQKIGRYEIIERIGHGGMSEVFKACCADDGSYVAIKLLHAFHADDPSFIHRFTREARAMSQLDHPSIVHVYDFDTKIETPYIAMEYLSGGTLKDKFVELKRKNVVLSLSRSVRIVLEIADALAYAHSRGMVHRDIKPANIIFNDDERAVLTDFGIVKTIGATQHTTTGAMIGTPAYMSPEQGLGRAGDARSDVYALGVLFFQMVTGRLPYDADKPLAVVLKHINEPIPYPSAFNPDIPEPLEAVIMRALAKNPLERFQSANDMAQAVRDIVQASDDDWALIIPQHLITPASSSISSTSSRSARTRTTTSAPSVRRTQSHEEFVEQAARRKKPRRLRAVGVLMSLLGVLAIAAGLLYPDLANGTFAPQSVSNGPTQAQSDDAAGITSEQPVDDDVSPEMAAVPSPAAVAVGTELEAQEPCTYSVALVNSYTANEASQSALSGETFDMNWVVRNQGNCPLPEGARFAYTSGELFGGKGELALASTIEPDAEQLLTTQLEAPGEPGVYGAAWQLYDDANNPLGSELLFEVEVEGVGVGSAESTQEIDLSSVINETAVDGDSPLDFNVFIQDCNYSDAGWSCQVFVVPNGGSGGNYTLRIEEEEGLVEYANILNQTYQVSKPGCAEWVQPVEVYDPGLDQNRRKNVVFNPNYPPIADMIDNQCQEAQ